MDSGRAFTRMMRDLSAYPDSDNAYLTEVANELLPEAIAEAKAERARQCAILCQAPATAESAA